jgi:hypothetical protein
MNSKLRVLALLLLIFVLLGAIPATTVRADPPYTEIIRVVDETFINDFNCPFPIREEWNGALRDTLFFDQNGVLTREYLTPQYQGPLTVRWTNEATGTTLTSQQSSALTIYYNPDGSFQGATNQGLTFLVHVPGEGAPLMFDVGRIVITPGQGITFSVGNHQELSGDTAAFCNYLAESH